MKQALVSCAVTLFAPRSAPVLRWLLGALLTLVIGWPASAQVNAKCESRIPIVSLVVGEIDDDGNVPITINYSFPPMEPGWPPRIHVYVDGVRHLLKQIDEAGSGTIHDVLQLSCSFPPTEIVVWATEGGDCPKAIARASVPIDSTPYGGVTATGPDADGNVQVHVDYAFPYTRSTVSASRSVLYRVYDSQGAQVAQQDFEWLHHSGTLDFTTSFACLPPGTYRLVAVLRGCIAVQKERTVSLRSTPTVDAQVVGAGSGHRADVQYEFPHSPNGKDVGRRLRLVAYDAAGLQRADLTSTPLDRAGTWPVTLATSCWPEGAGRVEVSAWCGSTAPVTRSQTFEVRNQPDVSVAVVDDPAVGPKARVTWDFPRVAGTVRVVMIVPPSGSETLLASFVPVELTGSADVPFTPPAEARTVTIQARASSAQECHYDVDAASFDCTCRSVGDPVDLADGNMRYSDGDPLPAGGAFALARVYDSRHRIDGRFGKGWTSALDSRLTLNRPYSVIVVTPNNEPYVFIEKGAQGSTFEQRWPRASERGVLTHDAAAGTYRFTPAGGNRTWVYTASGGRLAEILDLSSGRAVRFTYDANGLPATVSDSWGSWSWTVSADAATGLVSGIAVAGRPELSWRYEYDAERRLRRVIAPGALPWRTYEYVAAGMTEARDGAGKLLESHTYDAHGWAISSFGPSGEIASIQFGLPGSAPDETITRVTLASGAVTDYRMQIAGGTRRPAAIDGGCASCGGNSEGTTSYDAFGLVLRQQDARGYITSFTYDPSTRRPLTRTSHLQPYGCDPETDPGRCRLTAAALQEVGLQATRSTLSHTYTYGDPNWRDRVTSTATDSIVSTLGGRGRIATDAAGEPQIRRESVTYDAATGVVLSQTTSGWTGDPLRYETRATTTLLYDGAEAAAFNPGGNYDSAWLTLPQPARRRKSADGPRSDVDDRTQMVYYPIHASVPATLRGHLAATRNAAGQITRYERYDLFGNAERIVDANVWRASRPSTRSAVSRPRPSKASPAAIPPPIHFAPPI